jgi:hypothetical protein
MISKKRSNNPLRFLINPVTIITTVILVVGMISIGMIVLLLGRDTASDGAVTPVVTKIDAPTTTPTALDPTGTPTSTATSVFFLPEGVIGVGAYVQVTGTEGAGLRMRSEPGLDGDVKFTALDSEVFLVIEGPVENDGYTWWHLEAPYDETRSGWSVTDFLTPVEEENE